MSATLLTSTNANTEQEIMHLYKKAFPYAAKYVFNHGGSFFDATEVFQEAMVVYYETVIVAGKKPATTPTAYLLGISRNLWRQRLRRDMHNTGIDDSTENIAEPNEQQIAGSKLLHYLETAGKRCMDILKAFYYDKLPVKEIAPRFGFKSEQSARVQKYKCIEKVRNTVKQQQLEYADFIE